MLLYVHGTATLLLRSRNGFALRFARLLRCTSQTSTALRMTRTEKHRGWRATIHLALRDRSPLRVCAISRQTVRRFAYIVGGDLRTPRLCVLPPNGAATLAFPKEGKLPSLRERVDTTLGVGRGGPRQRWMRMSAHTLWESILPSAYLWVCAILCASRIAAAPRRQPLRVCGLIFH